MHCKKYKIPLYWLNFPITPCNDENPKNLALVRKNSVLPIIRLSPSYTRVAQV